MPSYTWVGSVSGDASNANNWNPVGVPASGDTAIFDATSTQNCVWNISVVGDIEIDSAFPNLLDMSVNAEIETGLSCAKENCIASTNNNTVIEFTGTPLFTNNYIGYKCANMFADTTARNNILFKFSHPLIPMQLTGGVYPHCHFVKGFRTQYFAPPTGGTQYRLNFMSIVIAGGSVSPMSSTPSADDRLMEFIIDSSTNHNTSTGSSQLTITSSTLGTFNGGFGTWTFQGSSSGFQMPVTGNNFYNGFIFKFENMILDSSAVGTPALAKMPYGCILALTNLTINIGVILMGASQGSIIHLVNRPTIQGTWAFFAIADGIYFTNKTYTLAVPHGGTGLQTVATGAILFGQDFQKLGTDGAFTYTGNTLTLGSGGIQFSDGTTQTTAATGGGGGGGIGVNIQDEGVALTTTATTLNFVDDVIPVQTVPTTQGLCVQATGTGAVKTITIDGSKVRASATDTLPTYLDAKLQAGANISITPDTSAAATTGHAFTFAADNNKVKISSADTTENFLESKLVAGSNITLTKQNAGANETIQISSTGGGGGGGGGYPLFKHDQLPSTHGFSPFRLLVDGDTIELGVSSGGVDNTDVSVFTPTNDENADAFIEVSAIGDVSQNTGREYIFYGQGRRGLETVYSTNNISASGYPIVFVQSMSQVILPPNPFGFTLTNLQIFPGDGLNNVRVLDAGEHTVLLGGEPIFDPENPDPPDPGEPQTVRVLLIVDYQLLDDGRGRFFPNYRLKRG